MDTTTIEQFFDQWLGILLDAGLICAVFLLWLSWFRNGKRQLRLERMLLETSSQLEAATAHLSQATAAIEQLKQQTEPRPATDKRTDRHPVPAETQRIPRTKPTPASPTLPAQNSTQATMILRMQREGESPQTIAERLDMPLAQVKLLLKLNAATGSVNK